MSHVSGSAGKFVKDLVSLSLFARFVPFVQFCYLNTEFHWMKNVTQIILGFLIPICLPIMHMHLCLEQNASFRVLEAS